MKMNVGGPAPLKRRGSYGIDAPYLLAVPAVLIVWNLIDAITHPRILPFALTAILIATVCSGLYTSRRGKFQVWAALIDTLRLRGDEQILDLGCGRGAVLLTAARSLTTGRAVGVDIWSRSDQSGNSAVATRRNADAEGVSDRVDLYTADMTALPFADDTFDAVLSNVAIHNVKGRRERDTAIGEALRVLRSGGRLMIADIFATGDYVDHLRVLGVRDLDRWSLGWRMWWSGPWMRTMLVTATKP
jgi:SAM-dependent methyltransferase